MGAHRKPAEAGEGLTAGLAADVTLKWELKDKQNFCQWRKSDTEFPAEKIACTITINS